MAFGNLIVVRIPQNRVVGDITPFAIQKQSGLVSRDMVVFNSAIIIHRINAAAVFVVVDAAMMNVAAVIDTDAVHAVIIHIAPFCFQILIAIDSIS